MNKKVFIGVAVVVGVAFVSVLVLMHTGYASETMGIIRKLHGR